jgi:hypothetical protein
MLVIILFLTSWTVRNNTLVNIRANPSYTPKDIKISNITDNSFTISYITSDLITGSLSYGTTTNVGNVLLDDKDKTTGKPSIHQLHYFTINNLNAGSQYYFTILSGDQTFNDNGLPYSVSTGQTLQPNSSNQITASGNVLLPDATYPKEAIIYIKTINSQLLSAPILPDGSFRISLATLRDLNLKNYLQLTDNDTLELSFIGDSYQASATVFVRDALHIPTISLSQQYSFTTDSVLIPTTTTDASMSAQSVLLPKFSSDNPLSKNPQIIVPSKDQAFNDRQPQFSGTALPYKTVDIIIQSTTTIQTAVKTDSNGNWSYRPTAPLIPGNHTITISTRDESGLIQTIVQSFVVHAEGSQFTDVSGTPPTPSPTISIPSITTTTIPTNIPSLIPTVITPSPTIIISTTPIIVTSTTVTIFPTVQPAGNNLMITSIGILTFAVIVSSMLFFFIH